MFATIQSIVDRETSLAIPAAQLTPRANLYALGLTSFDAIRLIVAIERAFKIEFPREALKRGTVATIETIAMAIEAVQPAAIQDVRKAA